MFSTRCHLFFFKVQYLVHFYSTFDYLYLGISKMDFLNFVYDNTSKAFENTIEKFTSMLLLLRKIYLYAIVVDKNSSPCYCCSEIFNIHLHAIVVEKNISPCYCCREKLISMLLLLRNIYLHAIVVEKNSSQCYSCWEKSITMLLLLRKIYLHAIVAEKNSSPCYCCWENFISIVLLLRKITKWKILTWFPLSLEKLENKEKGDTGGWCFLAMLIWSAL